MALVNLADLAHTAHSADSASWTAPLPPSHRRGPLPVAIRPIGPLATVSQPGRRDASGKGGQLPGQKIRRTNSVGSPFLDAWAGRPGGQELTIIVSHFPTYVK